MKSLTAGFPGKKLSRQPSLETAGEGEREASQTAETQTRKMTERGWDAEDTGAQERTRITEPETKEWRPAGTAGPEGKPRTAETKVQRGDWSGIPGEGGGRRNQEVTQRAEQREQSGQTILQLF